MHLEWLTTDGQNKHNRVVLSTCMLCAGESASCASVQAQTAEEKAEAIEQAVDRVNCTQDWLAGQTFLTAAQLEQWNGLVSVQHA